MSLKLCLSNNAVGIFVFVFSFSKKLGRSRDGKRTKKKKMGWSNFHPSSTVNNISPHRRLKFKWHTTCFTDPKLRLWLLFQFIGLVDTSIKKAFTRLHPFFGFFSSGMTAFTYTSLVPARATLTAHSPGRTPFISPAMLTDRHTATAFPVAFITSVAHSACSTYRNS